MKAYLIKTESGYSVSQVTGFKPKNVVAEIPDTFEVQDYQFLSFNEETKEVYLDQSIKDKFVLEIQEQSNYDDLRSKYLDEMSKIVRASAELILDVRADREDLKKSLEDLLVLEEDFSLDDGDMKKAKKKIKKNIKVPKTPRRKKK